MNIEQELQNYISTKENNGTLLITGKWGSGKTYLLKQIANKVNSDKEYLIVTISLFGIDSAETFHQTIKESVFFSRGFNEKSNSTKKIFYNAKKIASPILNALEEYSKIAKGINTALTISWRDFFVVEQEVTCWQNEAPIKKQLVLVFDDLERACINYEQLLGVINEYSENKHIKTILVANETYIEDKVYSEFKEKVVSRTIKLTPDYPSIIKSIIKNYNETEPGYCNFLNNNDFLIIELFIESSSENLRSLKTLLLDFERAYAAWKKSDVSTNNMPNVFYMFGAILFSAKDGKYNTTDSKYGDLFVDSEIKKKFKRWDGTYKLSSLKNWIIKGIWNEEDFIDEIAQKYGMKNISDEQIFLKSNFWNLEEKNIINGMPIIVREAYAGNLSRNEILELLHKIYAMKKHSVPFPCNIDYSKIFAGFELRKSKILSSKIEEPQMHGIYSKSEIEDDALALYDNIINFDNNLITHKNKKIILDYFAPDSKISEYKLNGLVIGSFDKNLLEVFLTAFYSANNEKKRDYARVILNLRYTDSTYITSIECQETLLNFENLKKRLNEYKSFQTDHITIAIITETIKELNILIEDITSQLS